MYFKSQSDLVIVVRNITDQRIMQQLMNAVPEYATPTGAAVSYFPESLP